MPSKHIIILGAGISGLSLAWSLKKNPNLKVTVLEKTARAGGWIQSIRKDGFLFELGPHSCRPFRSGRATIQLIEELGLQNQVITPAKSASLRYLLINQKLVPLPHSLISCFISPLTRGILPALWRDLRTHPSIDDDESIYDFIARRFSVNIAELLIGPLTTGIYAGDIKKLSVKSCFPLWHTWEKQYGSILQGFFKDKEIVQNATPYEKHLRNFSLFSFKDGMETLPKELSLRLEENIVHSCEPTEFHFQPDGVSIHTSDGKRLHADHLFSTLPASAIAHLLAPHRPGLAETLSSIESASVAVVNLGYRKKVLKQKGFGHLIPQTENEKILGMIWDSCVFPQQNQNSEETRLTIMIGGTHFPHLCHLNDQNILNIALSAAAKHLQIDAMPEISHITRAISAIPQYYVGHALKVNQIRRETYELSPHLTCIGSTFDGVSINDCLTQGIEKGERMSTLSW